MIGNFELGQNGGLQAEDVQFLIEKLQKVLIDGKECL